VVGFTSGLRGEVLGKENNMLMMIMVIIIGTMGIVSKG
jgi:hypothetical protein